MKHVVLYSVIFSLVFGSWPFQQLGMQVAYANDQVDNSDKSAEKEIAEKKQRGIDQVEQLNKAFAHPDLYVSELDPFLLAQQIVIDTRQENLQAVVDQVRQDDYQERIDHFENELKSLEEIREKVEQRLANLDPNEENRAEKVEQFQLILKDVESRSKIAQIELNDLADFNPAEGNGLAIDDMVDRHLSRRHVWGNNLKVKILDAQENVVLEINQKEFTTSLSPEFSKANPLASLPAEGEYTFVITDKKERPLHKFLRPIKGLFFYGHHLVYVEKSVDSTSELTPVRFIDLSFFRSNIGNSPLGVFTMPLKKVEVRDMAIENGYLQIGSTRLSYPQFEVLSKTSQVVFNVSAALADPATYRNVRPLIQKIYKFFNASIKSQDALFQSRLNEAIAMDPMLNSLTDNMEARTHEQSETHKLGEQIRKVLGDENMPMEEKQQLLPELMGKWAKIGDPHGLRATNAALHNGRSFMNRLRMLAAYVKQPRPEGTEKMFNNLVVIANQFGDKRERAWQQFKEHPFAKFAKYGGAVAGTLLASQMLPAGYAPQLQDATDFVSATWANFQGYLTHIGYGANYVRLAGDAFVTSVSGWMYLHAAYLAEGKWWPFLQGIGYALWQPLKFFLAIHFAVNGYKALRGTLSVKKAATDMGWIKSFVTHADQAQAKYWGELADAEKRISGSDVDLITDEEVKLLEEHVQRLREGRDTLASLEKEVDQVLAGKKNFGKRKIVKKALSTASSYIEAKKQSETVKEEVKKTQEELNISRPKTVSQALTSLFMSWSSMRNDFKFNALLWNPIFMIRSFGFFPSKWLMAVMYPNYFRVTVGHKSKNQHFPSEYNGGLRGWPSTLHMMVSKALGGDTRANAKGNEKWFFSKEALEGVTEFEKSVGDMEQMVMEIAMKRAQLALFEYIDDPKRLQALFDAAQRPDRPSTGIQNLHDKKIKRLNLKERLYYRAYFTRTFDVMMQKMLVAVTDTQVDSKLTPAEFAKSFMKEVKNSGVKANFDHDALVATEKDVESRIDFDEINRFAAKMADGGAKVTDRMKMQFRHKLMQDIHPKNPQIQRYQTAKEKVEEPRSMERAMRLEIASLTTALPMGLVSMLALYAGVQTGMLQPFDPNGLDSKTHFMYMSRYLIWSGFIPGVLIQLLANTWMKVQEDDRIDKNGGFDKQIRFADSKKGFWRYYIKNVFWNPENKWKDNQLYRLKLIWANMPAAAFTIGISQLYGMQRIDLGSFVGGYLVIYATALAGMNFKMDQGFELASNWVYSKIPRKLRAHKIGQGWANKAIQAKKFGYTVIDNFYGIVIDANIAGTMLVLKDSAVGGTRYFLRLLGGGFTPTELLAKGIDSMIGALKVIPGVTTVGEAVKTLFTNNYEAFERYPERLGPDPGNRNYFPKVPEGTLAAIIGRGTAFVGTVGAFALSPYVLSEYLQRRREKRIQLKGDELLQEAKATETTPEKAASVNKCNRSLE